MEAMGKEVVIVETVGIGQDQVSVAGVADTLIVTVIPGMGDYLQALKAGIMEMGDIFVVNKADRKGVDQVVMDLTMMRSMNDRQDDWIPPIVKTIAQRGEGVAELMSAIELHRDHIAKLGLASLKRTAAAKGEIVETLKDRCFQFINGRTGLDEKLEQFALQVVNGTIDRHTLVESILRDAGIID
jgi:LAO/AO transport system kinase